MEEKKTSLLYKIIKGLVWFYYPKLEHKAEKHPEDRYGLRGVSCFRCIDLP